MITFKKVRDAYGWMGNMSPHRIDEWRSAEAFFQALRFTDPQIRMLIWSEKSPMGSKMVAKKHADKMVVTPRSPEDIDNMRFVLERKFHFNPELVPLLLATGDEEIVEDVTNRPNTSGLFWGKALMPGFDPKTPDQQLIWSGQNVLGLLLMERRGIIRACPPTPSSLPLSS